MNHYEILKVSNSASQSEIKKSYRKLVKRYHPDINPGPKAMEMMIRINEAYEILSDTTTRSLYDLYLKGIPVKTKLNDFSSEERYRSSYKMNRVRKQRAAVAEQIIYTQEFYASLRKVCMVSLFFSLILAYDYNYGTTTSLYTAENISLKNNETVVILRKNLTLKADNDLYASYVSSKSKEFRVLWSSILKIPINIGMSDEQNTFLVKRSIYIFGNGFSVILFFSSLFIVGNKKYTDSRLTFGLISSLTLIWILGMLILD